MIVYHGSPYQFNRFSFDKMRTNGTSYGVGFYMTDLKDFAKSYATTPTNNKGYLYEIEFKGQKPLEFSEVTLSNEELRTLILKLHEEIDFLWNINDLSFYPLDYVLDEACRLMRDVNDVETIAGIINTCGDAEVVLGLFARNLGYSIAEMKANGLFLV